MYQTKEQDHQKRAAQEGSYSLYNYLYHYLLDNYEPSQLESSQLESSYACESTERLLVKEGIAYARKANNNTDPQFVKQEARKAITNFCNNDGARGDTANNMGKAQDSSFNTIKQSVQDLRW